MYTLEIPHIDLAQAVGFISLGIGIFTATQKNDKNLKLAMLAFLIVHMTHFALLGAYTAVISCWVGIARTFVSLHTSRPSAAYGFALLGMAVGSFSVETVTDFLPLIATCVGTLAIFLLKGIQMRIAFIFGSGLWLANNIIVGSIGGAMLEVTITAINLITIARLAFDQHQERQLKN